MPNSASTLRTTLRRHLPSLIVAATALMSAQVAFAVGPTMDLFDDFTRQIVPLTPVSSFGDKGAPTTEDACGGRSHVYSLKNSSVNADGTEVWAAIPAFAIVLGTDPGFLGKRPAGDDFFDNVDTTTILCTRGDHRYALCGFRREERFGTIIARSPEWQGTTVSYERLDFLSGSPSGLVWRYGVDKPGDLNVVPWVAGRTSPDEDAKGKVEGISFSPLHPEKGASVTTSAYALSTLLAFEVGGASNVSPKWKQMYSKTADPDGDGTSLADPDHDHFWWSGPLGVANSSFRKCPAARRASVWTDNSVQIPASAAAIKEIAGLLSATGWEPTPELSAVFKPGDIFDGKNQWQGDGCFAADARTSAYASLELARSLSGGLDIGIPTWVNAEARASTVRHLVLGEVTQSSLSKFAMVPTVECLTSLARQIAMGADVSAWYVVTESLSAPLLDEKFGTIEAGVKFVGLSGGSASSTASSSRSSQKPIALGFRRVRLSGIPEVAAILATPR